MILLPLRVITESKVESDSEPILKYPVAPDKAMKRLGTMILLHGAGGEPGRGEIPMSLIRNRTPVDFLFMCLGDVVELNANT